MRKSRLLARTGFLVPLLLLTLLTSAQRYSTGKVTDAKDGSPLAGASVIPKGFGKGAITGSDGSFRIRIGDGTTTLIVTCVGYATREVAVSDEPMTIALTTANTGLNEVVVVGYGTQRKKELTGAISKVSAAEITALPTPSVEASLEGRAPGVQVSTSSGLAGAGSYVRIRGIASVSAGGDPLYVIDGIPIIYDPLQVESNAPSSGYQTRSGFTQSPLAAINPDDIESIEILKDAGAAGIYGSRGANGVILITTKRGRVTHPTFNFSTKVGFSSPSVKPDLVDGKTWLQLRQEGWINDGYTGQAPLPYGLDWTKAAATNTNWFDILTRTGVSQEYNLSMSYGTKKFRSYIGGTYAGDQSYAIGNKFTRYAIRGNFDYVASPKFKASLTSSYSRGVNDRILSGWAGGIGAALSYSLPIFTPYNMDGSYNFTTGDNPLFDIKSNKFTSNDYILLTGLILTYTPVKNLNIRGTGNFNQSQNLTDQYTDNRDNKNVNNANNQAQQWNTNTYNYDVNLTADYRYEFNKENVVTLLAGTEFQKSTTYAKYYSLYDSTVRGTFLDNKSYYGGINNQGGFYYGVPTNFPGISKTDSLISDQWAFISYFARANYSYDNKFFIQGSARIDGSSKFGPNNRYGFFPAVAASYVLSDEKFIKEGLPFVNYLKIRTSYGITGNAQIPTYKYLDKWVRSPLAYDASLSTNQTQVPNPNLKWETANNYDAGLEFTVMNSRISGEIGYYNRRTKDVLMNVNLEEGYGIGPGQTIFQNIGKVKNEGVELSLNVKLIATHDLTWTVFGNASRNYNEVLDAGGYQPDQIQVGTNETRVVKGYPIGTVYTFVVKGVDPANGLPIYLDDNGKQTETFPTDFAARRAVGKLTPDWYGGFGTNVNYKGLELNALFVYSTGLSVWDNSGKFQFLGTSTENWNFRKDFLDRWQKPGDMARYPRMTYNKLYPGLGAQSDFSNSLFLEKADFMRLRELTLAYRFTAKQLSRYKIKGMRVFFTGMNLLLWTKYPNGDPEVNRDADGGTTDRNLSPNVNYLTPPQPRTLIAGINLNF